MKTIEYGGSVLAYEVYYHPGAFLTTETDKHYTYFYNIEEERKKFWLFGPRIKKCVYKYKFRIEGNADSPEWTKADWRKELNRAFELYNREQELNRGELI